MFQAEEAACHIGQQHQPPATDSRDQKAVKKETQSNAELSCLWVVLLLPPGASHPAAHHFCRTAVGSVAVVAAKSALQPAATNAA